MKTKLTCILSAIAITAIASSGAFNNNAASSAPGINEVTGITASLNAPPNIATLAANQDPAVNYAAALYIPDPATAFNNVQPKIEVLSITAGKEEGINTAGANSGTPQTTNVIIMKTDPGVATNGTTQLATNPGEIAVNSGPNGSAGHWQVLGLDTSPAAMQLG